MSSKSKKPQAQKQQQKNHQSPPREEENPAAAPQASTARRLTSAFDPEVEVPHRGQMGLSFVRWKRDDHTEKFLRDYAETNKTSKLGPPRFSCASRDSMMNEMWPGDTAATDAIEFVQLSIDEQKPSDADGWKEAFYVEAPVKEAKAMELLERSKNAAVVGRKRSKQNPDDRPEPCDIGPEDLDLTAPPKITSGWILVCCPQSRVLNGADGGGSGAEDTLYGPILSVPSLHPDAPPITSPLLLFRHDVRKSGDEDDVSADDASKSQHVMFGQAFGMPPPLEEDAVGNAGGSGNGGPDLSRWQHRLFAYFEGDALFRRMVDPLVRTRRGLEWAAREGADPVYTADTPLGDPLCAETRAARKPGFHVLFNQKKRILATRLGTLLSMLREHSSAAAGGGGGGGDGGFWSVRPDRQWGLDRETSVPFVVSRSAAHGRPPVVTARFCVLSKPCLNKDGTLSCLELIRKLDHTRDLLVTLWRTHVPFVLRPSCEVPPMSSSEPEEATATTGAATPGKEETEEGQVLSRAAALAASGGPPLATVEHVRCAVAEAVVATGSSSVCSSSSKGGGRKRLREQPDVATEAAEERRTEDMNGNEGGEETTADGRIAQLERLVAEQKTVIDNMRESFAMLRKSVRQVDGMSRQMLDEQDASKLDAQQALSTHITTTVRRNRHLRPATKRQKFQATHVVFPVKVFDEHQGIHVDMLWQRSIDPSLPFLETTGLAVASDEFDQLAAFSAAAAADAGGTNDE